MRRLLCFLLCTLLLMLASCSRPSGEHRPSDVLYQDDFSEDAGRWILESDLDATASHSGGELRLAIDSPNLIAWAELRGERFEDFTLEVDASQTAGPDNNSYGVIFRIQNPSAYYRFDISGDGYYAFLRRDESEGGRWVWITEDWQPSSAIRQGVNTNRIKIVAQDDLFQFFVNGEQLLEANDSAYHSGSIGLAAGAFQEPGVNVAFDNLIIKNP